MPTWNATATEFTYTLRADSYLKNSTETTELKVKVCGGQNYTIQPTPLVIDIEFNSGNQTKDLTQLI